MKSENKETQRREDDARNHSTRGNGEIFRRQGSPTTNSKEDGSTTAPTKIKSKENGSPTAPRDWHGGKNGSGAACNDYRSHVLHRKVTAFADS